MHQPSNPVTHDPDAPLYLGFDVGGTKCAAIVGTADGQVLDRQQWPARAERGPKAMIADFLTYARSVPEVAAAGVSIGGPVDVLNGVVLAPPHLPGWDRVPLKAKLEQELQRPVGVQHDAAACALAEHTWGRWHGCHCLIYLTCGTGFGAGIVIDGVIYHGARGHSIEIGHARHAKQGPEAFGKVGSVEAYCSGTGLALLAQWKLGRTMAPEDVAASAAIGNAGAQEVLELHANATGQVCANLADTLFPDAILLGSLSRYLGPSWLRVVEARFAAEVHPHAREVCRLQPATLGERVQDLSALIVAVNADAETSKEQPR